MSERFSCRSSDGELIEWMNTAVENNSGWIEDAMIEKMEREKSDEGTNGKLTKEQRIAYKWLCETYGHGQHVNIETVKNYVAQRTSLKMGLVQDDVIRALDNKGLVKVVPRINDVVLKVNKRAEP